MSKLIKCKECNHEIGKKAKKCPQCGAPQKKGIGLGSILVLVFLVAIVFAVLKNPDTGQSGTVATTAVSSAKPAADCAGQSDREVLIDKMEAKGYWQKVSHPGNMYRVHVLPSFIKNATFDDKQKFISVVAAYGLCKGGDGTVEVYDAMTDKKIGFLADGRLSLD